MTGVELVSPHLRVQLTASDGLRISGLARTGVDENILGEFPDVVWPSPWGPYAFAGGHRLWIAPERQPDVCEPEPDPTVEVVGTRHARLGHATPSPSGFVKTLEIEVAEDAPELTVRHVVENRGAGTIELAPWALTMLDLGGIAFVPHDEAPIGGAVYTPNRLLVGWPYTRFDDERLTLRPDVAAWRAEPGPAWKLGTFSNVGRIAYARGDVLLEKRFAPVVGAVHADGGCNVEVYSNDRFVEIETLGPLAAVEPGAAVEHVERWVVHTLTSTAEASLDGLVAQLRDIRRTA